ncbi:MAG: prepilin-type N-terminal cleavage/methylation domain-containing protein [Candidatus Didemnitutus sp.]|nr:prepilin-type N-terminal cleavage/methylation domain-containing protein [Candidatus Didemnitutus sp.]
MPVQRMLRGNAHVRAFTLVEVLLVLALLALFAAIFIPGVNSMLAQMDERGPDQIASEAVLAARTVALESGHATELAYDVEKRQLLWGDRGARSDALPAGVVLDLLPMEAGGNILLGGELSENQEPLKRVRFFPDGTCQPFRLRLRVGTEGKPRVLVVDPWTCALSPAPTKGGA